MTGPRLSRLDQLDEALDALPGAGRPTRPRSALDALDADLDGTAGPPATPTPLRVPGVVVTAEPPASPAPYDHAALLARNEAGKRRDAAELDALQHPVRATAESLGEAGRSALTGLGQLATHPWQLVTEPASHIATVLGTPVVGEIPHDPRLTKGGNPLGLPIRTAPYTAADGAITPGQLNAEGARAVADLGLLGAGRALPLALAAGGALHSPTTRPEDVGRSALSMLLGGTLAHGAATGAVKGAGLVADAAQRATDVSPGMVEAGARGVAAATRAEAGRLGAAIRRVQAPASALDQVAAELDAVNAVTPPADAPAPAPLTEPRRAPGGAPMSPGVASESASETASETAPSSASPGLGFRDVIGMSADDLERHAQEAAQRERTADVDVFGTEGATQYRALRAAANNPFDTERADRASAAMEDMERALTPDQQRRLFGIGETGYNADELRAIARAARDYDPANLADRDPAGLLSTVGRELTTGRPHEDAVSALRLRGAAQELARRTGQPLEAIVRQGLEERVRSGHLSAGDAVELLRARLQDLQRAGLFEEVSEPAVPRLTAGAAAPRPPSALDRLRAELEKDVVDAPEEAPRVAVDADGVDRFTSARTPAGRPRPPERVHTDGLVEELDRLEQMQRSAEERSQYRYQQDENFHSTEDGRTVVGATRRGGGGSTDQGKAFRNMEQFQARREAILGELQRRGLDDYDVWDRVQALQERRTETEGLRFETRDRTRGEDYVRDEAGHVLFARPVDEATGDLFGAEPPRRPAGPPASEQGALFGEQAGTEASRTLRQTEAAARAELATLHQRHALTRDVGERQRIAQRIATLERLTNRGQAIGAAELGTRLEAERGTERGPAAGPSAGGQETFLARALEPSTGRGDVPQVPADTFGGADVPLRLMRKTAFEYARRAFRNLVVRNAEQGWDVRLSRDGLSHATRNVENGPDARDTLHAIQALPELVRDATLTESWSPKAKPGQSTGQTVDHARSVLRYHHLRAPIDVGDRRYTMELTLRELHDPAEPKKFYHLKSVDLLPPANEGTDRIRRSEPLEHPAGGQPGFTPPVPTREGPRGPLPDNLAREAAHVDLSRPAATAGGTVLGGPRTPTTPEQSAPKVNALVDDIRRVFAPASRSPEAHEAALLLRERNADLAMRSERAREALNEFAASFDRLPATERLDFIDRIETGAAQPTPQLTAAAAVMRSLLDTVRDEIRGLGTGKLEQFYETYFPHLWQNPEQAAGIVERILGKRELAGPGSFLKRRSLVTFRDGIEAGLVPVSTNPVDLVLLKLREMNRYLLGQKILGELKERTLVRFVHAQEKAPRGYQRIDDKLATVYGPPTVQVQEAFDLLVRQKLEAVMKDLGVTHVRTPRIGHGNAAGYAEGGQKIATRAGGEFSVIEHELGHVLDAQLGLWDRLTTIPGKDRRAIEARKTIHGELRALADLRFEGQSPTPGYRDYVRQKEEKIANAVLALLYAPERMQQAAPTIKARLTEILRRDPRTAPLLAITPSLVLGSATHDVPVGGLVIKGHYWAPETVALVLNHHLSPGLRGRPLYDAFMGVGNSLNQVQLGLSAFHLGMVSLDAAVSATALGIERLNTRDVAGGLRMLGLGATPFAAPVRSYLIGSKVLAEYLRPGTQGAELATIVDALQAAGGRARQDAFYTNNATARLRQAAQAMRQGALSARLGASARASLLAVPAVLERVAAPMMERFVPRMKLGVFLDLARHELAKLPPAATRAQVRAALAPVWDSVENRMGQLTYDNLFWHRLFKDAVMASTRSVGWNVGTIRELGGGALDIARAIGREGRGRDAGVSHRAAYVFALPFTVAVYGALLHYLYTGQAPAAVDLFYPRTGRTTPDGHDERVQLPSYLRDVVDYSGHPWQTITNKLHPLVGVIGDMLENRDFFGTQVRNPDDPLVQQAAQLAHYLGTQLVPFGIQQAIQQRQAGQSPVQMAQNFVGITPAPRWVTRTPAEERMQEVLTARGSVLRTPEQAEQRALRGTLGRDLRQHQLGAKDALRASVDRGRLTGAQAERLLRQVQTVGSVTQFQRLTLPEAVEVMRLATPEERRLWMPYLQQKVQRARGGTLTPPAADMVRAGLRALTGTPR